MIKMKKKIIVLVIISLFLLTGFQSSQAINLKNDLKVENKTSNVSSSDELPSYFNWRDRDGVDFVTPIRNQGMFPSCETFAFTAAIEAMVQIKVGYPFGCDLSEAHLFFFSGGNIEWGSYPENDTNFLVEYGIPDEACWPYPEERAQLPLNMTSPDWQQRTVKLKDWYYLPENETAIKKAIVNNGPVPTYFHVYQDFMFHRKGIYKHRWGKSSGPHYVCIVGYNDDPGYWIVKNSWGTGVNDEGWFNIAYGECEMEKKAFYFDTVYGQFPIAYVDDDNTAGPWDGSEENPYQCIQQAIDEVYEGYTIYVKNGTYYENITVNKKVNIDGENKETTIIDGGKIGDVVTISEPYTRISGFTIQNSGDLEFNSGIKTLTLESYTTIKNNIIRNNNIGIFLNYVDEHTYPESWNIVTDNIIYDNVDGIYSHWAINNNIQNNKIFNNTDDGMEFVRSPDAIIKNNEIKNNGKCGIFLRGSSFKNILEGNTLTNNSYGIKLSESNKNKIQKNNFIDNCMQATFYNSFLNKWRGNYWSDWNKIRPRPIWGKINKLPWVNHDIFSRHNLI